MIGEAEDRFSALRHRDRPQVHAGRASSTTRTGTTSRRASASACDVDGDGKTVVRAGYGPLLRRVLAGLLRRPAPVEHVQSRRRPTTTIATSASRPSPQLVPGAPVFAPASFSASDVFTVDPKLRTPYMQNYNVNLQRELGGARGGAGRLRRLARDATLPLSRHQPGRSARPARAPFPGFVYINQFESTAQLAATTRCRRACAMRQLARAHLDAQLHAVELDRQRERRPGLRAATRRSPTTASTPRRERADSNFDVRHRLTWYFTWDIGGAERPRADVGLVAERRRHARERTAVQRQLPLRGRLQRQRRVLRAARPRRRSVRGHRRRPTGS